MSTKAFLMAFTTVVIWGSTFAAIRASLHGGYSAGHLVLTRYGIASIIFILIALIPRVKIRVPHRKDLFKILILGFVGISLYNIGVTFGELTISAGNAGMLIGSTPIFTALIAVSFLKEKLGKSGWIGMFIGFIGILLITLGTSDATLRISIGAVLVLMAAIATSVFFVFQKSLHIRYSPLELTAYFTWAGTIPFLFFSPGLIETIQNATLEANLSALYTGIFPASVAYLTWATALSLGRASSVTSMLYIEPVVAIFTAWIWLQEWPSTLSLIGGLIAISGVVVVNGIDRRQPDLSKNVA
ncbi:DMT family transporter [Pseudalkalibacillus berkeleyi]|uniref:DMT family transporter n=1 Tax=Pseudalkalibacillus berkeleyi TaxID=1069813 RepID=A0ABS9GUH2_9BACL|nr:DMT family transporter [Pseudalkalibacillus berkeleyi]MCF6136489.1 DMT family transporter [Pseudalkalibacillus berkeleyi]